MMYAPDLSEWTFNRIMGLGDKEHNRILREKREAARPVLSDINKDIILWNIWVYYQKDLARQLSEQKKAGMAQAGFPQGDPDDE